MAEDKRSHWQFLANLLGAESKTPQPAEPRASESAAPTVKAVPRAPGGPQRSKSKVPAKSSPPADWGSIASKLGLKVEKPLSSKTSAVDKPPGEEAAKAPADQAEPMRRPPDAEQADSILDHPVAADFPSTLPGFGVQRPPSPPPSVAGAAPDEGRAQPAEPEPHVAFAKPAEEVLATAEVDVSDTPEFDSKAGEVEDEEEKPRRRRSRRRRRRSEARPEGNTSSTTDDSKSETEVEAEVEETIEDIGFGDPVEFTDDESQPEADEPRRPRRRRRRRRPSTSKSSEEAKQDSTTDDRPTPQARDERPPRSRRPKRPAVDLEERDLEERDLEEGDDEDDEVQRDDDVGNREEAEEDGRKSRRHFTSWPEAIEQVIATNLANRSKSNGQGRRGRRPRDGDRSRSRAKRGD